MYIADMHCDSLSCVNEERGLVNSYNFSSTYGHLQFVAHFSQKGEDAPEQRRRKLIRAFDIYLSECERLGISRVSSGRELFDAISKGQKASVFTVEGGGGLFADSPELPALAGAGLAVCGLAWDGNELSASAWDCEDAGLTDAGKAMVERLTELGVIIDVSHLSDKAFYDVFEISAMPHLATHSNFRDVCQSPRNLTRDMARRIAMRGGVIGINLYPEFLREGGDASAEDILRHIDFGLELLGDKYIGFGFDIDGTDGKYPRGFDESASIHDKVMELLLSHYGTDTVERICGLNVIDFLKNNLM